MGIVESLSKIKDVDAATRSLAAKIGNSGLSEWEFGRLIESMEGMFKRFAPWKVGVLAVINNVAHNVKPGSGWYGYRDQLADGTIGKIIEVDFQNGKFTAMWQPIDQMIYDHYHSLPTGFKGTPCCGCDGCINCNARWHNCQYEGPVKRLPDPNPGCFGLSETHLQLITLTED